MFNAYVVLTRVYINCQRSRKSQVTPIYFHLQALSPNVKLQPDSRIAIKLHSSFLLTRVEIFTTLSKAFIYFSKRTQHKSRDDYVAYITTNVQVAVQFSFLRGFQFLIRCSFHENIRGNLN